MVELIPCVDLILQMEPIPVVELIPVNDMIPTFMILIPTYPHCGIGDSNSNSKKYWNHNTSNHGFGWFSFSPLLLPLAPLPLRIQLCKTQFASEFLTNETFQNNEL